MSLESAILNELRGINEKLKSENSYIERFKLSKASVVSAFGATLRIDGQEFNLYVISTDGDIADISYQVVNKGGGKVDEIEAEQFAYIPGPVTEISFKNDTAESGKSIFVTAYKISRLAPPMMPPAPPGTGTKSQIQVDPEVLLAGLAKLPYSISLATNPVFVSMNVAMSGANTFMSFESPVGTDYTVPANKKLELFKLQWQGAVTATYLTFGYGDDGVANGTSAPTALVRQIGSGNTGSPLVVDVVARLYEASVYASVPADKIPMVNKNNTNGLFSVQAYGVEVDA